MRESLFFGEPVVSPGYARAYALWRAYYRDVDAFDALHGGDGPGRDRRAQVRHAHERFYQMCREAVGSVTEAELTAAKLPACRDHDHDAAQGVVDSGGRPW